MSEVRRAKVFWSGRSQAVRLPLEFRFDADEVSIRREGNAVILEPLEKPGWPAGFWEALEALPPLPNDFELPLRPGPPAGAEYRDALLDEWTGSPDDS